MATGDNELTAGSNKTIDYHSQLINLAIQAATNLCNEKKTTQSVKTPISLLQEIATKMAIQPVYVNISTEGQVHEPIFIYKLTMGDISVIAKGNSKKKAKHAAALEYIHELKNKSIGKNEKLTQSIDILIDSIHEVNKEEKLAEQYESDTSANGAESGLDSDLTKINPIGSLLELTQKFSLRPPAFEFGEEEGLPHNKQFVCTTAFGEFNEVGFGRSKKLAKRQAAFKLLAKLKMNPKFKENDSENLSANIPIPHTVCKDKNRKTNNNYFVQMKHSTKPTIMKLLEKTPHYDEDTCDQLSHAMFEELAKEENIEYKFFRIEKNNSGLIQVLLQIKISPILVVHGNGTTLDKAIEQASHNGLTLLKLLCSK